jgi:hypothetical protein
MSRIFHGGAWYHESDLDVYSEKQISDIFKTHAQEMFIDYDIFDFEHVIRGQGLASRADLCVIKKDQSSWCVIEVEKSSHDYWKHVLPQLKRFKDSVYDKSLSRRFCEKNPQLDLGRISELFLTKPPGLLVVVDRARDIEKWREPLEAEGTQLMTLRLFKQLTTGAYAIQIDGTIPEHDKTVISTCRLVPSSFAFSELTLDTVSALPAELQQIDISYNGSTSKWKIHRGEKTTSLLISRKNLKGLKFTLHKDSTGYTLYEA